jgi:hypothetical protein
MVEEQGPKSLLAEGVAAIRTRYIECTSAIFLPELDIVL